MLHTLDLLSFFKNMRTGSGVLLCSCVTHISSCCHSADISHLIIGFWLRPRIVAIKQSFGENQKQYNTSSEFTMVWSGNTAWERQKWEEVPAGWPIISQMRSYFVSHHLFLIMSPLINMSAERLSCLLSWQWSITQVFSCLRMLFPDGATRKMPHCWAQK